MNVRGREASDAGGHYVTAGAVVIGLGLNGLGVAWLTGMLVPQDLGFIDVPAMALFSAGFVIVGLAMVWEGRRLG